MTTATDFTTEAVDESGSPPGDRAFRPDVQGLRAIAILLVVLFHASIPGIRGGYVGVDVFFVISGFVITGLLLRERESSRRTSLLSFYARRARRILPAGSLVIIVTVIAAFFYLGSVTGHETAVDGQWASVFLANFHFAASETNYLASQRPPSALQNYWSLAVEEQFYIVYPLIFLITASLFTRTSLRLRLALVLLSAIVVSFTYSVIFTSTNAPSAFFSPLTRAWELALGGLIAVAGVSLRRVPHSMAAVMSWIGLVAILVASVALNSTSPYPGSLVAIPVLGAGLVIAGGAAEPAWGVEVLLKQRPFQLLGLISYSLYLWHWPILVIATQRRGVATLPIWEIVLLLIVAALVSIATYRVLENPVRHAKLLIRRPLASVGTGICLIALTLAVTTVERQRPTVDLGTLATADIGSACNSPAPKVVDDLRSSYRRKFTQPAVQARASKQTLVVVGDSTACTLLPGLVAVGPSYGMQFENGAVIGCGIVSGQIPPESFFTNTSTKRCQGEANRVDAQAIERFRPNVVVWASTQERNSIVASTPNGSENLASGSAGWTSVMLNRINARVAKFVAAGANVVLLLEPASVSDGKTSQSTANDLANQRMNDLLEEVAARHPAHVAVVNLGTRVCPSGPPCPYVVDGMGSTPATARQAVRPDGVHYLPAGSLWVADWLVPQIQEAAKGLSDPSGRVKGT